MNAPVFDLHSHTHYSACGRDEPEALVETVMAAGVDLLGITDHSYGIGARKAEYRERIEGLKEAFRGRIRLLCGIEIPSLPHVFDFPGFDFHEIRDYEYCLIEHITDPDSVIGKDLFAVCEKIGIRCGIAHTDLFAYCVQYGLDMKEFFGEMSRRGIFWEMNVNYDSIHQYREHTYVKDFMELSPMRDIIRDAGVYVSVGFDSHRREDYDGARVRAMNDFLRAEGILTADQLFP